MKRNSKTNRLGYTLMEILIAASILSVFFAFMYKVFSGSSDSFNAGAWRVATQKQAQLFLVSLKGMLEKANYADTIAANGGIGVNYATQPIYINTDYFNKSGDCSGVSAQVLFFAITQPKIAQQSSLGIAGNNGLWSGVSLYCQNGKLTLKRTGDWDAEFQTPFGAPIQLHAVLPADFPGLPANEGFRISLNEVGSLSIFVSIATDTPNIATGTTVEVSVTMVHMKNNVPTGAKLTEQVKAKLLKNDHKIINPIP